MGCPAAAFPFAEHVGPIPDVAVEDAGDSLCELNALEPNRVVGQVVVDFGKLGLTQVLR